MEARLEGLAHRATATATPDEGSVFSHELLNLAYDTIEFVDEI